MTPAGSSGFVGRAAELARVAARLDEARSGAGRTVVIGGEAGVGKTRFVRQFLDHAVDGGARVLSGACLDLGEGGGLPYAPFVEALRALVRATDPGRLPALLGPSRTELAKLLPELAVRSSDLTAVDPRVDPLAQGRLFELVLGVIERLARTGPVVLVVDDAQWADHSTRDLLGFLIRALRSSPVLVLVVARTDGLAGAPATLGFLAELERDAGVSRLELEPLGREDVAALVGTLQGHRPDPDELESIVDRTDGNPFFVEELVAAGERGSVAALPPRLEDVLEARFAVLSAPAQEVLRAAAAAGREVDDTLLLAALDVSPRGLVEALREAVVNGLLEQTVRPNGRPTIAFRHALLQELVDGKLFPGERARLHAAFARALEARVAAGDDVPPAELARHWEAAGDAARTVPAAFLAGEAAQRVYAHAEAGRQFARALRSWDRLPDPARPGAAIGLAVPGGRSTVLERAAECAALAGDPHRAVELGRSAIDAVDELADPGRAGELHERLRWFLWEAGERAAATAAVEVAIRLIPSEPPSAARAMAIAHLAGIELLSGEHAISLDHAAEAARIAHAVPAPAEEALALGILGWNEAALGDVAGGLAHFEAGRRLAIEVGSVDGMVLAATNLASLLDRVGQTQASLSAAEAGLDMVRRFGVERTYGSALRGFAARGLLALGRWDEAEAVTVDLPADGRSDAGTLWLLINRSRLLTGRGRFLEAAAALERATAIDERLGPNEFRSARLAADAELAVWRGHRDDARAAADAGGRLAHAGPPDPSLAWLAALALRAEADEAANARARRDAAAMAVATERVTRIAALLASAAAAPGGRQAITSSGRGQVLSLLCRAEARRSANETNPSEWAAVAEGWLSIDRPYPAAYARFREAEVILGRRGPRAEAVAALEYASGVARRLGAIPLAGEVATLARHARIELHGGAAEAAPSSAVLTLPSLDRQPDPYGFTPRETEILALVADGWSNLRIADALFISRKTASVHVSNILAKLGVESRIEAAAVAMRLGLTEGAPLSDR